ncbi:MAG: thioredoxin domain-containing protein [Nitrospirae bacterium]|uniref:thioredoxin domain-containing protein n=1 Tax=Candidatus Magnetobacterium casense TaxID=1455061 RepID=UPI00069856F8|nr:thioredoxin domain-containing protein [Candidatus Magnetobacterium casensis]MBF0337411.1 thioredoxin domain-containing protein [Nitrospirota bacterium]
MSHNRLKSEKSPYLLQHADNPVDWYPWGAEAFTAAQTQDKPVFVSIGYSTCHWCHVMAHESFEDNNVAAILNDAFICVKVDREERPDVDSVYINACQIMTGTAGWPLTVIMTPDKKPFFTGTYIPRSTRNGYLGLIEIAARISDLWQTRKADLHAMANKAIDAMKASLTTNNINPDYAPDTSLSDKTYQQLSGNYDPENGGFGTAPKFPAAHNLMFLMRYFRRTNDSNALEMVETTLSKLRQGGIFDQLGFGFHRYSTDAQWLVPHFEKMLYDQAMLTIAYAEAFQLTGKRVYETTLREVLTYVLRDMRDARGGFYCSEDADSNGVEGLFYLWRYDEITEALGETGTAELAIDAFNVRREGNFHNELTKTTDGRNILHLRDTRPESGVNTVFDAVVTELLKKRRQRIAPFKDTKILTDWNGLMIGALAVAARVVNEPLYLEAAKTAADFVLTAMSAPDGRLRHCYKDGNSSIDATLDDYAFLVYGLTELYESSLNADYLHEAGRLNKVMIEDFHDTSGGGFYMTPSGSTELPVRPKDVYDGAYPSGNSIALVNLVRLSRLTADNEPRSKAHRLISAFAAKVQQAPLAYTMFLNGVDLFLEL